MSPQEFATQFANSLSWESNDALLILGRKHTEVAPVIKTTRGDSILSIKRGLSKRGFQETASLAFRGPDSGGDDSSLALMVLTYQNHFTQTARHRLQEASLRDWVARLFEKFLSEAWNSENHIRFLFLSPGEFPKRDCTWLRERISGRARKALALPGGTLSHDRGEEFSTFLSWHAFYSAIEICEVR